MMQVTVLCTDPRHPVNHRIVEWAALESKRALVRVCRDRSELMGGDFLFLVSCHQIIGASLRAPYRHSLVLHAGPLPRGRGMSPHVWQVLEGSSQLTVTLLKAEDAVDSGDIWSSVQVPLNGAELHDEIHRLLFDAELRLMSWALDNCDSGSPTPQVGEPTYYPRRTPDDSRIDPTKPLAEAFDLLRIADPERYPAYFEMRGKRFSIRIERMEDT